MEVQDPAFTCANQCLLLHNLSACASLGPEPYTPEANAGIGATHAPYQQLAEHYQVREGGAGLA